MAKKKRKRRKPIDTIADTPVAKKRRRRRIPERGVETDSLPPTKKSTLPPELAHDDREIDARTIFRFTGTLLGVVVASMILLWFLDSYLTTEERAEHEPAGPMATSLPTAPAEPRLQRTPKEGLAALKQEEREQLHTYGWEDKRRRVVRIPIDRAIEILAERGLPTRTAPFENDDQVSQPSDSSLDASGGTP